MKSRARLSAFLIIIVAASLKLAACGSSSSSSSGTTSSSSSSPSPSPSPSTGASFTFNPPPGTVLPDARVGAAYSQTIQITAGGNPPFQWKALSAPPGFNVAAVDSQDATITVTPTAGQTGGVVQIQVTDATVNVTDVSYFVRVDAAAPALTISPSSLPNGARAVPYNQQLLANGGQIPFAWSMSGSLPPGVALGTSTTQAIAISGTPTTAGTFNFTLNVTDGSTPTRAGSLAFSITIN